MQTEKYDVCCVCLQPTANIHMHHTIPRSLGGEDSLQIPLDGDCHTKLHAHASAIVAKVNGKRKSPVVSPWTPDEEIRVRRWLEILVHAMLNPPNGTEKMTLLPQLRVDGELRSQLEILKRDSNLKNLENTLLYCIQFTIKAHGIPEHEKRTKPKEDARSSTSKPALRRLSPLVSRKTSGGLDSQSKRKRLQYNREKG